MFRKPFSINQTHKVSGADRKKIRRSVEKALHLDGDSTALDALLPAKQGDLELAKLPAPSRLVIYLLDGLPVLLDTSGKSDFVPTVMGLWSCPGLLPVVMCKAWQVSQYLCGGANLMLPGVDIARLPDFNKGDLLAVCVPCNPAPVAVGAAVMNSMAAKGQSAGKGKLLEVLQHYGDTLWQGLGRQAVPNDGFQQGFVAPLDLIAAATAEVESAAAAGADAAAEGLEQLSMNSSSGQGNQSQQDQAAATAAAGSSDAAAGGGGSNGGSSADMDDFMERSLLQALLKSIKDTDLPLNSSSLWSQHITPCRPVGSTLDVKKSSHKKMSKFLQVYTKAGLITTREEKHSGDTLLTGVNIKHTLFDDFRTHKTAAAAAANGGGEAAAGPSTAAAAAATAAVGQEAVLEPLLVEEVYVPSKEVKPIFQAVGADTSGCYTAAEAGEVAFAYAKQQQLDVQGPDERTLLLDEVLCDALYKGVLRKGEIFPTTIPKANLREAFLKRCSQQTRLSRGRQQVLRRGNPPAVQISGERRQGNKYVTRVVGVEAFLIDPAALASECQRKYACSTTVGDLPGKNNPGQEVILQGNVIEKLPDYLMKIYGIPKKYFLVKK